MSKHWALHKEHTDECDIFTGLVGTICPNCGRRAYYFLDHVKRGGRDLKSSLIKCHHCDFTYKINPLDYLDPNITKALEILNRKGYKTKFSCEGHDDDPTADDDTDELTPTAYISFTDTNQKSILKDHPLPDPWYLGEGGIDEYFFVIRASKRRCSLEDWEARCDRITEWAESLAAIECGTEFKYGYGSK